MNVIDGVVNNRELHYFECLCDSREHTIAFRHSRCDNSLYLEIQLNRTAGFFRRIKLAVKYIFGYECKFGHWDCTLFDYNDITRMIKLLETVKNGNGSNGVGKPWIASQTSKDMFESICYTCPDFFKSNDDEESVCYSCKKIKK